MESRARKLLRVSPELIKKLEQYEQDERDAGWREVAEDLYQARMLILEYQKMLGES